MTKTKVKKPPTPITKILSGDTIDQIRLNPAAPHTRGMIRAQLSLIVPRELQTYEDIVGYIEQHWKDPYAPPPRPPRDRNAPVKMDIEFNIDQPVIQKKVINRFITCRATVPAAIFNQGEGAIKNWALAHWQELVSETTETPFTDIDWDDYECDDEFIGEENNGPAEVKLSGNTICQIAEAVADDPNEGEEEEDNEEGEEENEDNE